MCSDSRYSGVTSFNYDSSVIGGDRSDGGNRIRAPVESEEEPVWASRDVALDGPPGLQGGVRVARGQGVDGGAQVSQAQSPSRVIHMNQTL